MILLLIIADDFTGALDTGVQFAARGARTEVVVDPQIDFSACGADVLVVDTETRHLPAADAYKAVFDLVERARRARVRPDVALILDGQEYTFEGIVNGTIAESPRGGEGFGYDPVFIPDCCAETSTQKSAGL